MIVRKVAFEKTIGMPNYSNDRPIVVEADLEPGETKEQAWTSINQDMIEWHKKEYPHLYQESKPIVGYVRSDFAASDQILKVEHHPSEDPLSAIQNAATLEDLKSFKLVASTDKTLYEAYCTRIKQLA